MANLVRKTAAISHISFHKRCLIKLAREREREGGGGGGGATPELFLSIENHIA